MICDATPSISSFEKSENLGTGIISGAMTVKMFGFDIGLKFMSLRFNSQSVELKQIPDRCAFDCSAQFPLRDRLRTIDSQCNHLHN